MATVGGKLKTITTPKARKYHPYRVSRVPRREVHRTYDRIYATIYGHCVGDALGLLTEGLTKEEVKKHYREVFGRLELVHKKMLKDSHRRRWQEADWTDETDQLILVLQSLIHNQGNIEAVDFARRLSDWSERGFPELGDVCSPGVCSQLKNVVGHCQFSEEPLKAAEIVWRDSGKFLASNSALARTAVIGIHHYNTLGHVIKNTLDLCRITHADPRCQASCVAVTTAIALMLQKNERHMKKNGQYSSTALIDECFVYASKLLETSQHVKELKFYMHCTCLKELKLDETGRSSYTYKALGAGFWALKQKDFRQAIQDVVLEGGDADANAAVAGALLGAKLGLDALPKTWVENLVHRLWLDEIIDEYFDMMEGRRNTKETIV